MSYSPAWPAHCTLRGYADYLLPNADDKTAQIDRAAPVTIYAITAHQPVGPPRGALTLPLPRGFFGHRP